MFVLVNFDATLTLNAIAQVNNMSIPALQRTSPFLSPYHGLFTFLPSHMEALIRVGFDPDGLKLNKNTYIQNKIQKKKRKKGVRNVGGLIIPKSAGLFLIHLNDVFVLHPQLFWSLVVCDSLSFKQKP